MRINHNIAALNTHNQLNQANNANSKSMEKLSSGLRINRAGDDAAGLAISEKMRGQIRGLEQAERNAQDGISMIQTAEGAMNETHSILQRMRELAVQSSNDTNTTEDRAELQKEVDQLASEITRIGDNTEFNTKNLLDGSFTGKFQIGANEGQNLELSVNDMRSDALQVGKAYTSDNAAGTLVGQDGSTVIATWKSSTDATSNIAGYYTGDGSTSTAAELELEASAALADGNKGALGIDISSQASADKAVTTINTAIETVSAERSKLGANQNRLEHTINNLSTSSENLTAAESRIRDVDMAAEIMNQTKQSILSQASQSMLAKANQNPQNVLQLLR
ncbi:flagellin [Pontibacillus halophilus JSM 076056 = DSM 19796]|uniref:Flagellin n=1 Tax=Pontibacillus halophilus JSM 076056 = DSM 19796 TaxID=1385510 RepID=A0A0A5GPQ5_9BACI|nr:flagellin [Pontibacillus halophilus]KGX93954.1 flagellin [Pontibacillus halophilus JSM 076056 = DSM 19796]